MNFEDLFVFEMANNHQGSISHGKKIIDEMYKIAIKYNLKAAIKLQFRHYDTFIHPEMMKDTENPKVKRFLSTRLTDEEHEELCSYIRDKGLLVMVTPFDEISVLLTRKCNVDILKIGSPSLYDFSLLESVASENKPVIISSGGCNQSHIDKLYNFFKHRFVNFALMHCVSVYPTPNEKLNLNVIEKFKKRYKDITIGFSTHESPDNFEAIKIAYALGARIYEKHIGVPTDTITLNKYSANPEQTEEWIKNYLLVKKTIGDSRIITEDEKKDLDMLYRGIFINKDIKKGDIINDTDIYFAFPKHADGILTGDLVLPAVANKDYIKNEHVNIGMKMEKNSNSYKYLHMVRGFLNENSITIPDTSSMEISHHYGIDKIFEFGCFIASIVNNDKYSNKIIVLLSNQKHPDHYHKLKDESFYILNGELEVTINKTEKKILKDGDILRIPRMTLHSFSTTTGCIFEEISTTHYNNDSYYLDNQISNLERDKRKTYISNWAIL